MATLKEDWKKLKKTFEDATGKKKPAPKLLGVFRGGTGIEAALDKVDKAKTKALCKTAIGEFVTKKTEYVSLLKKNQVGSNNDNYKVEIDKLILELQGLEQDAANKMMAMPG